MKEILVAIVCLGMAACDGGKPVTDKQTSSASTAPPTATLEDPSQPRQATLEQQKMCSEQAQKKFKEAGFKIELGTTYSSHYDARTNICYEFVTSMSASNGIPATTKTVFDAFEGREYASYAWANATKKKYWEVAPMMCVVRPRAQAEIDCKTSDEFDALVDKYFGVAP